MNLLNELKKNYKNNSKNEKKIIDFIIENPINVLKMTLKEFSQTIFLGEATILRFLKKKFNCGYSEFKLLLSASLQEEKTTSEDFILDKSISLDDTTLDIAKKIQFMSNKLLKDTIYELNFNNIDKAVSLILNANKIIFVGTGFSNISAKNSCYKFMRIGFNCFNFSDPEVSKSFIRLLNKDDLVIAFSQNGVNIQTQSIVKLSNEKNLNIIGITIDPYSDFAKMCTIVLEHTKCENKLQGGSFLGSLSQMFIIEMLYTLVVLKKEESIDIKRKIIDE